MTAIPQALDLGKRICVPCLYAAFGRPNWLRLTCSACLPAVLADRERR